MPHPFEKTGNSDPPKTSQTSVPDFTRPSSLWARRGAQDSSNDPSLPQQPESADAGPSKGGGLDGQQRRQQRKDRRTGRTVDFIRAISPGGTEKKIPIDNRKEPRVKQGEGIKLVRDNTGRKDKLTAQMMKRATNLILEDKVESHTTTTGWTFEPIYAEQEEGSTQNEQVGN